MTENCTYNPLDRSTFEAIAYNAIGRASEINTYPAYALTHSTGNSGWSVGAIQWDFGQPGRGDKVDDLLSGYQAWAQPDDRFTDVELASLSGRLKTRGQVGNDLSVDEKTKLEDYLRSDQGRTFVDELSQAQIERKWERVGEPLSQIEWMQRLAENDPQQAAEIVAMTSKLYNQNEVRGGRLLAHLQENELTSDETRTWIGTHGINGLRESAQTAIISGRDNALHGIRLFNALEMNEEHLGRAWREEIHTNGNVSLTQDFNNNPTAQLFDGMMRNPVAGSQVLAAIDDPDSHFRPVVITGINQQARLEMARIELDREGTVTLHSTRGFEYEMTADRGLHWTNPPAHWADSPSGRATDEPDYNEPGRAQPSAPVTPSAEHDPQAFSIGDPQLDRLAAALFADDEEAISRIAAEVEQSPEVQAMIQEGHRMLAEQERQQEQERQAHQHQGPALSLG